MDSSSNIAVDLKEDLYELLQADPGDTKEQLVKAYRKRALKCHPDKNPDNPAAAEQFLKISKALEILTDAAAKAAYDKLRRARQAAKERNRQLDAKRQKLKADLEARERAAQDRKEDETVAEKSFEAEIERLRKEGSQLLRQEQELLKAEFAKESQTQKASTAKVETCCVHFKVKWKSSKAIDRPAFSDEELKDIFSKYGRVNYVVSSKKASAVIELITSPSTVDLLSSEKGPSDRPLSVTVLDQQPSTARIPTPTVSESSNEQSTKPEQLIPKSAPSNGVTDSAKQLNDRDFESVVLSQLRRKEERKRIIEQMAKEDELSD